MTRRPGLEGLARPATVRVPIHFHPDVFDVLRRRAEREQTSIGEIVLEIIEKDLGA